MLMRFIKWIGIVLAGPTAWFPSMDSCFEHPAQLLSVAEVWALSGQLYDGGFGIQQELMD